MFFYKIGYKKKLSKVDQQNLFKSRKTSVLTLLINLEMCLVVYKKNKTILSQPEFKTKTLNTLELSRIL